MSESKIVNTWAIIQIFVCLNDCAIEVIMVIIIISDCFSVSQTIIHIDKVANSQSNLY